MLWDAAELTQRQSWDWDAYYAQTGVGTQGAYVGKTMPMFPVANVDHWDMCVSHHVHTSFLDTTMHARVLSFARMLDVLASRTTPYRLTRCSHVC